MMFPLMRIAALAALSLCTSVAIAQRSSVSHKHVVVRHTAEDQSCTMNCYVKEAFLGSPHAVGDLLKLGIGARQVHGTPIDGVPAFPRKTTWVGPDESDLIVEMNNHVQSNINIYAAAMTAWQASRGLATATHDIIQKVTHRGKLKRAVVNVITFDNGNFYFNGAKFFPDDASVAATVLYVRATPSAPSQYLSAAWNWPNAGTIQHAMRSNFDFVSDAPFTTTNVGNTYDEPFGYNTTYNPDARLQCLFSRTNAGCGQAQPDVASLLGAADATFAIIDYYRVVKPVGQPYGGGLAGVINARVTDRTVTFACAADNNGTYNQIFRWSQKVEYVIDRYTVYPDGKTYFVQRFKEERFPLEVATPGTSPINRFSEYPNLGTRFLHHRLNNFTDAGTAYPPNAIPLTSVTTITGASCGCAPQTPYTESLQCSSVNASWSGAFTRSWTYNTGTCSWNNSDDTSTCTGGGPACPVDCVATVGPGAYQTIVGPQTRCNVATTTCLPTEALVTPGIAYYIMNTAALGPATCPIQSGPTQSPLATCVPASPQPTTVPFDLNVNATAGADITITGPGVNCTFNVLNSACTAQVPANSTITLTFVPNFLWGGPGQIFYGIFTLPPTDSCTINNNAVWSSLTCSYNTGTGGSISMYVPRCTNSTGWTTCM